MRKILLISNGDSIHTIKWVEGLQKKYKIFLFDWRPIKNKNFNKMKNVTLVSPKINFNNKISILLFLKSFFTVNKKSNEILPDIIHAHYATSYGLLGVMAKNTALITSVWGTDITDFPHKSIFHMFITKYILGHSDYIYCTSKFLSKKIKRITGKESSITPFGIAPHKELSKTSLNDNNSIIFGTAKNLKKHSGLEDSLFCFAQIKKINPNQKLKYFIAGSGPYEKKIMRFIRNLGIENDVKFYGHVSHERMINFYKKINVYINIPSRESFGVAVLEAAAAGLPSIVSNIGGLPEIVLHKETGLIVDRNDKNEIINAMNYFVNNKEEIIKIGLNAKSFVEEKYSWTDSLDIMNANYESIIDK